MFVQFLISTMIILVAGPIHNEGGAKAIEEHGFKAAIVRTWDERDQETHKRQDRYNQ